MLNPPGSPKSLSGTEKSDPADEIDYLDKPELYFNNLEKLKLHAENIRIKESKEEKALLEFLPVNEKFSFNKEGKVLTKWQERQRDWDRIQAQIQRKLNSKIKKPLMMTTADEYRAKLEELDLVQASIPIEERFNETTWQTQLRGGGAIRVAVGHVFSGLECEYEQKPINPKLVRKPKPVKFVGKNDTFVDQSASYLKTKKKFDKFYREIRPHDLPYSDANNLVIKSTSLFKWAKDSSENYFHQKRDSQNIYMNEEQSINDETSMSLGGDSELKSSETIGPSIQFISSNEISFDAMIGKSSTKTVEFKNNGAIALLYKWRLLTQDSIAANKDSQVDKSRITIVTEQRPGTAGDKSTLREILSGKGTNELSSIRSHLITQHRDSFFCSKDIGEILPDEIVTTTFIFKSRAGTGSFSSEWILEFIPDNTNVLQTYNLTTPIQSIGFIVCNLHGYCYSDDESVTKRQYVTDYIQQAAINTMAKDIVYNCLRRVRDPVRIKDIHSRQNNLFQNINQDLILAINSKYSSAIPIFITPYRLEKFCEIYNQSSQVFTKVTTSLVNLHEKRKKWMTNDEISQYKELEEISENPLLMNIKIIDEIKFKLFPEQNIEIFDEITENQYYPRWNYNLTSILTCLNELLIKAEKVNILETEISILEAIDLKIKIKAERKAERLAVLESDEEYEEEEEEEEEETEEALEKPLHPYIKEVQSLIASVYSGINVLVVHPLPSDEILKIATEVIFDIADFIVISHEKALEQANIVEIVNTQGSNIIPSIPSPFTTTEGEERWHDILNAKVAPVEIDPKSKGGKAAAKPTKGAPIVTNTELSKEQVDIFYKAIYDEIYNSLLNVTVNMFTKINEYLVQSIIPVSYKDYKSSMDTLFDISVPRKADLTSVYSGKVAFMSWNGSAFTDSNSIKSAFNLKQMNKENAIKPIMKLITYEAQAIVLLYEPNLTTISLSDSLSILINFDEIKEMIEQKYQEYILKNNKVLKKNKEKPGEYKQLSFSKYKSFAEFYYNMSQLLNRSDYEIYFSENLPIIILETISLSGVVPIEPSYEEILSDDDDAPVTIGLNESMIQKQKKWELKRPYPVKVPIEIINKSSNKTTNKSIIEIECYADSAAAISEAYFMKPNGKPFDVMWIESYPNKLYDPNSSFEKLNINGRFVSEEIREMILWCGIFQIIPKIPIYLSNEDDHDSKQILDNEKEYDSSINIMHRIYQNEASEKSNIKAHLTKLFPYSSKSKEIPNVLVIIAGNIRADKFCVLDQLIDSVDTIYLGGEMALAFISLSKRLILKKYTTELTKYTDVCIALITKARMKGCTLIFPIDLVIGEESIKQDDKMRCYHKFELDNRSEGSEYESDTKVYDVINEETISNEIKIIDGYAYDIGPKSCQILKDILIKTELLLVWGTIGVCEIASFQNGQQILIDNSIIKVDENKDNNDISTRNPLNTILFGDSTIEWYTRIIDSDGELNGDLVNAGIVTYSNRDSTLLAGIMGLFHSSIIQNKLKFRPCNDLEWIYSSKQIEIDEEGEEEDDDDE